MSPSTPLGDFVWYELLAIDQARAKSFYTAVLGWTTEDWQSDPAADPYTMWMNRGTPLGGIMALPEGAKAAGAPSHWLAYVSTPDTNATLGKATGTGAKALMGPMDVPTVGRIAVLADPQGAVIAIYTPANERPAPPDEPPIGTVSWHELATDDWQKAWTFYSGLFGWKKGEAYDMGPIGTYQLFGKGGPPLGAVYNRPPEVPVSNWLLYFLVADLDATLDKVRANGGQVLYGPLDVPGGKVATCMDPQGAAFALHWKQA